MLQVKKVIIINYTEAHHNIPSNIEIPILLSSNYTYKLNSTHDANLLQDSHPIKISDIISVELIIKNQSETNINSINLKIINDNNFTLLPGSLINSITKEIYSSAQINGTSYNIPNLNSLEELNINFYIQANFKNIGSPTFTNHLVLLPNISSSTNVIEDLSAPTLINVYQAILDIYTDSTSKTLTIKNTGYAPINNMILKYSPPTDLNTNISCISANINNKPTKINSINFDNYMLFFINTVPKCNNQTATTVTISFKAQDIYSLDSPTMTMN